MHPWGPQQKDTAERFPNFKTQKQEITQDDTAKGFRTNINPGTLMNCKGHGRGGGGWGLKHLERQQLKNSKSDKNYKLAEQTSLIKLKDKDHAEKHPIAHQDCMASNQRKRCNHKRQR